MSTIHNALTKEVAHAFVGRHARDVIGVLHGWDRLRLQGTLRSLYYQPVMEEYLRQAGVLWKDFKTFATPLGARVRQAAVDLAARHHRPMIYLNSSRTRKEDEARKIQQRDKIELGLIAVFSCVEPCRTWFLRGNRMTRKLELRLEWGKCIHLYFYWMHEQLGFLHLRLQTWFPFLIQICFNGREWLARQMDRAGLKYERRDNCFTWIEDMAQAQCLLDQQLAIPWQGLFEPLVDLCHPHHREINAPLKSSYYWTLAETEFATDIMFKNQLALQRIYPALVHHSVMSFGSEQVLRFLSRRNAGDVRSDCRRGPDGVRVKHWFNQNSLKLYDKGSVLRSEMTINKPEDFRVWRGSELNAQAKKWRTLRRSVVDVGRRAEVSRAATHRHLEALAAVHIRTPLAQEAAQFCKATRRDGRSYRALQP